jgi:hypothetical protein
MGALHICYEMLIPNQVKDSFAILAVEKRKFQFFTGVHGGGLRENKMVLPKKPWRLPIEVFLC